MSRFCRSFRRPVASLLAVWMTVIGLGVSVTHAHAAAGDHHVHGRGWNLSGCPVVPTSNSGSSSETHRHLYLLGVEFPNDTVPDTATDGATVFSAPATDADHTTEYSTQSDTSLDQFSACFMVSAWLPDTKSHARHLPHPPASQLSHFARRAVTGVLRS